MGLIPTFEIHIRGLREIVDQRGGVYALKHNPCLEAMVYYK